MLADRHREDKAMKIATWNINGVRARTDMLIGWMQGAGIDVLALQETKARDEEFPAGAFDEAGFDVALSGQPSYNGVAIVTRRAAAASVANVIRGVPGYPDEARRLIVADVTMRSGLALRVASAYMPNGKSPASPHYGYKLEWMSALALWVKAQAAAGAPLVLLGDFNVAPEDKDAWSLTEAGGLLVSAPERQAYRRFLECGLEAPWDRQSAHAQPYSWWDYRGMSFQKGRGMRIDHILAAPSVAGRVVRIDVDAAPRALEKTSDHAPVVAEIADGEPEGAFVLTP
ncbi:MAG: exodeoxyribonuclease III [Duodenibacillus sp.]|nr:exodeoxyribonuclease III [Duodenibacillus sp.]